MKTKPFRRGKAAPHITGGEAAVRSLALYLTSGRRSR